VGSTWHLQSKCVKTDTIPVDATKYVFHGTSQAKPAAPKFYLPNTTSILADHEIRQLEKMTPTDIQALDEINSQVTAPRQTLDVDSLLHIHRNSSLQERRTDYYLKILTCICTITIVGIFCFSLRSYLCKLSCTFSKPTIPTQTSPPLIPALQRHVTETRDEIRKSVIFTSYAAQ